MAHGGGPEWNRTVSDLVAPLRSEIPVALAFGMADPATLGASLDTLRSAGVERVAVVRLFVSGKSFLDQTEYVLGLSDEPPAVFAPSHAAMSGHGSHGPPSPIEHGLSIATHEDGLMVSAEAQRIMLDRVRHLSSEPGSESVLLVAHGMGDDAEDREVVRAMEAIADRIRAEGFAAVRVATLREDWAAKREVAEDEIRAFVASEADAGRRVLVVPMRLSGFGPYAEVLEGLEFTPGEGLLPHEEVTGWLRETASQVVCANGWASPIADCR